VLRTQESSRRLPTCVVCDDWECAIDAHKRCFWQPAWPLGSRTRKPSVLRHGDRVASVPPERFAHLAEAEVVSHPPPRIRVEEVAVVGQHALEIELLELPQR
jgi:hypothetical protein